MKIMMVITGMCSGGAERVMSTLCNELSKRHDVRLVSMRKEESDYALSERVQFVKGGIENKNFFQAVRFVRREMCAWKPDVMLSFMTKSNLVALAAKLLSGQRIPLVIAERANPHNTQKILKPLRTVLYPLADGCVFQTMQAQAYYKHILRCSSVVLKNPLSEDFHIQPYQGQRRKVIVTMGRLSREKNQQLLIEAFAGIAQEYPDYSVEIYGEGPEREKLQAQIARLNLEERVKLMGRKKQIQQYVEDAEIFVLPSNSEGMPNALIEAMAMGLVSIATDCPIGGCAVIIRQNENGILIPMNDRKALEEALKKCLTDKKFADRIAHKATDVIRDFDAEHVCKEWEAYLLEVQRGYSNDEEIPNLPL